MSYIHNVVSVRRNFAKKWVSMCLLVVLGSQGIVVKCTVTIFLGTVDYRLSNLINQLKMGGGGWGRGCYKKDFLIQLVASPYSDANSKMVTILSDILSRFTRHSTISVSY